MATYNGADKRLQYLFSHIGDGANMSGTSTPTDTAVDNTLYIQYDSNDGSVVALWVYLNGTWTEVETAGGNLYGTDEPTEEADEGALYIQYDSTDYSVTALWAYIGADWREISLGGGGGASGGARYTETELFNGTATMGTAVEFSEAWNTYDLLIIEMSFSSSYDHVRTMVLNTADIEYGSNPNIYANGFYWSSGFYALARFSFPTTSSIRADTYSTTSSEVYTIKRVIGIKWEIQETALIYSEEEREVGVWTNGKPLYQKSFQIDNITCSSNNAIEWNISNYVNDVDLPISIEGIFLGSNSKPASRILVHRNSAYSYNAYLEHSVFGISCGSSFSMSGESVKFTIRYTKTTDTAGSGTYITTGGYAHHYSTTEHVVGTWIDGKPIYEKTFEYNNIKIGRGGANLPIDVSIKMLLQVDGLLYATGSGASMPFPITSNSGVCGLRITQSGNLYLTQNGTDDWGAGTDRYLYLTLQYTKTTD